MSIFDDDEKICDKLNDKYVFVGLNGSNTHINPDGIPWKNFHSSDNQKQQDYKLRYTLKGTKFWGSYITDIIKVWNGDPEEAKDKDSGNFMSKLRKHPEVVEENIEIFKEELIILADEKPILIAMGDDACKILKKNMKEFEIKKIRHYSANGGPEFYKDKVFPVLKEI
ncbi:hypothetical protein [Methanobrevibacter sp.]|uniref:hypothetical protein n=1 Tax=Methanobrevibacter sp. TaxID=66852 RepID=UPI003864815C